VIQKGVKISRLSETERVTSGSIDMGVLGH